MGGVRQVERHHVIIHVPAEVDDDQRARPPGNVATDMFANSVGLPWFVRAAAQGLQTLIAIAPEEAAETPVFLAQSPQAVGTGGRFYGPWYEQRPVPARVRRPERSSRFWAASEALVRPYLTESYAPFELRRTGRAA